MYRSYSPLKHIGVSEWPPSVSAKQSPSFKQSIRELELLQDQLWLMELLRTPANQLLDELGLSGLKSFEEIVSTLPSTAPDATPAMATVSLPTPTPAVPLPSTFQLTPHDRQELEDAYTRAGERMHEYIFQQIWKGASPMAKEQSLKYYQAMYGGLPLR